MKNDFLGIHINLFTYSFLKLLGATILWADLVDYSVIVYISGKGNVKVFENTTIEDIFKFLYG